MKAGVAGSEGGFSACDCRFRSCQETEVPVLSGKTQTKGNADPNVSIAEEGAARKEVSL